MPKLNTNNEEVIRYFCGVCEGCIRKYDIDGIRFDVGNEVSHRFLKKMREHLKAVKPDIYLLGEIWHDASQWLMGDEYDSVMNYPLMSGIHDYSWTAPWTNKNLNIWSIAVIRCICSRTIMCCLICWIPTIQSG